MPKPEHCNFKGIPRIVRYVASDLGTCKSGKDKDGKEHDFMVDCSKSREANQSCDAVECIFNSQNSDKQTVTS